MLTARALQLTSPRGRRRLARALERLVEQADEPVLRTSPVVPVSSTQVREAISPILAIAIRLRRPEPVNARGVALLSQLLSDGGGPCYAPAAPGTLARLLEVAERYLDAED